MGVCGDTIYRKSRALSAMVKWRCKWLKCAVKCVNNQALCVHLLLLESLYLKDYAQAVSANVIVCEKV